MPMAHKISSPLIGIMESDRIQVLTSTIVITDQNNHNLKSVIIEPDSILHERVITKHFITDE